MSAMCPSGQTVDKLRTPFGQCMDAVRTLGTARTLDPSRPVPTRLDLGEGLNRSVASPSPSPLPVACEIWQLLLGGLHALPENDYGRPWPYPNRRRLAELAAQHDADLCLRAARQAREIVISQDRAPNITALFEKKLHDLAEVRAAVRQGTGYSEVEFVASEEGKS